MREKLTEQECVDLFKHGFATVGMVEYHEKAIAYAIDQAVARALAMFGLGLP